jgi:hypothetical protein
MGRQEVAQEVAQQLAQIHLTDGRVRRTPPRSSRSHDTTNGIAVVSRSPTYVCSVSAVPIGYGGVTSKTWAENSPESATLPTSLARVNRERGYTSVTGDYSVRERDGRVVEQAVVRTQSRTCASASRHGYPQCSTAPVAEDPARSTTTHWPGRGTLPARQKAPTASRGT